MIRNVILKVEPEFVVDDIKPLEESDDTDNVEINSDAVESDMEEHADNLNEIGSIDTTNITSSGDTGRDQASDNKHSGVPEFFRKSQVKAKTRIQKSKNNKQAQDNKVPLGETNTNKQSDLAEADSTTNVEAPHNSDSEDLSVQLDTSDEDTPLEGETILVKTPPEKEPHNKVAKYEPLVTKYASSSGTFTVTSTEHSPTVKTINKGTHFPSVFSQDASCLLN